jgi:indolepyruvate ferredoxin oxidoreductase beta subunit
MKHYNILVCGVGGTGVIGFGNVLKQAAALEGIMVVGNEVKGRAQRGGGVTNTVRYTILEKNEPFNERKRITGALPQGSADLMIATEAGEGLRNVKYLSERSVVIINTFELRQVGLEYPDMAKGLAWLRQIARRVIPLNASDISMANFGSHRMTNQVLLGAVAAIPDFPIKLKTFRELLKSEVEAKAFELGLKSLSLTDFSSPAFS